MKNLVTILLLILFFTPKTIAATSSFKTYTPVQPYYNYNRYNRHLPPPPSIINQYDNNRFWKRRNYYNNYYNSYNYDNPYYYQPKRTLFNSLGDFFSGGKITGYTNSNFEDDIPYGYQQGIQDSNGNYYQNNYDYQSGATIKILD